MPHLKPPKGSSDARDIETANCKMAKKSKHKPKTGIGPSAYKATRQQQSPNPTSKTRDVFTLADEARQTTQHDHSFWSQDTKLRSMPISFISAGISEPLKAPEGTEDDEKQANSATPSHLSRIESEARRIMPEESTHVSESEALPQPTEADNERDNLFYYDTSRDPTSTGKENARAPAINIYMPGEIMTESDKTDSEGEVILFKGRNATREKSDTIDMENIRTEIYAVEREIEEPNTKKEDKPPPETTDKRRNRRGRRSGKQVKAKRNVTNISDEEDDGMLADYIENMRENGEMLELLGAADISEGSEDESGGTINSDAESNAEELSVEEFLAMQPSKQTSDWISRESTMEYTDFDPMDWENPSLRRKKGKGTKQKLDLRFADIDSDTERRLQATWRSDRLRKAERKKEREQLRALNLIGKKTDKSDTEDMRVKYPKGMSLEQVADELKRFLLSSDESISLPPMDKHARKMIHELANKFNVKSKSIGKADQRRPTLYRTKRTLRFNDAAFDLAVRRIHRRYFPRLDYKGKSTQGQSSRNGHAEASYRDGEIVGASAPELSTENRGRAMLEKMGWSRGTALGSEDNKGILLPVMQTMKRSKAGLG